MKVKDLSIRKIKTLKVIGENPNYDKEQIANSLATSKGVISQYIYKFREYGLVVEAIPELAEQGYNWLLTGKGLDLLKDGLKLHLQEIEQGLDVEVDLKSPLTFKFYRANPASVRKNTIKSFDSNRSGLYVS